ncbi:MAG: class I SAM-dependent methyltransferase [Candidatus Methanodesulfokora washburnensis]|jgi:tRNA (uracil-5-)-methyltransferase TRM9
MSEDILTIKREIMHTFDKIAGDYSSKRRKPWPEIKLVHGRRVLDAGCGPGRNSKYFLDVGSDVFSVDISIEMLRIARKMIPDAELVQCDITSLPFKNNAFDCILLVATLHHVPSKPERLKTLKEIFRVTSCGGEVLITVWSVFQPRFLKKIPRMALDRILGRVKELWDTYIPWGREKRYYHLFSRRELVSLVKKAGFYEITIHEEGIFPRNHVVIARKGVENGETC